MYKMISMVILVSLLVFQGCGEDTKPPTTSKTPTPSSTTITKPESGAKAGSSGKSAATAGSSVTQLTKNLGSFTGGGFSKPTFPKPTHPLVEQSPRHAKMAEMSATLGGSQARQKSFAKFKAARQKSGFSFAPQTISNQTDPCDFGGKVTYSGTFDEATGQFNFTETFVNCRNIGEDGEEILINGTDNVVGTHTKKENTTASTVTILESETNTVTFTDGFTVEFFESGKSAGKMKLGSGVKFTEVSNATLTVSADTLNIDETYTSTADGKMTFEEKDGSTTVTTTVAMTNFKDEGSFKLTGPSNLLASKSGDGNEGLLATTIPSATFRSKLNGHVKEDYKTGNTPHSVNISFVNYEVTATLILNSANPSASSLETTINGTITTDFTPDDDCDGGEGTFTFKTIAPLKVVGTDDEACPTSGELEINGNTRIKHKADGGVDVTVDGKTTSFISCKDLSGTSDKCVIEDFD